MPASAVLFLFIVLLVIALIRTQFTARRIAAESWESLLDSLDPVRAINVKVFSEKETQYRLPGNLRSFEETIRLIGGPEGLKRMRRNADVLIRLAACAEQTNAGLSQLGIDHVREEGFRLKRAYFVFSLMFSFGIRSKPGLRAVSDRYCDLVESLLALYKANHTARYPALLTACNW